MGKGSKEKSGDTCMNPYEKSRMLRVQENKSRLMASGIKDIATSLTSLVEKQKAAKDKRKEKKKQKIAHNGEDGDYIPDLDSCTEEDQEVNRETFVGAQVKHAKSGKIQANQYLQPMMMKKYATLAKQQQRKVNDRGRNTTSTVSELILNNNQSHKQLHAGVSQHNSTSHSFGACNQFSSKTKQAFLSGLNEKHTVDTCGEEGNLSANENEMEGEDGIEGSDNQYESDEDSDNDSLVDMTEDGGSDGSVPHALERNELEIEGTL